MKIYVITKGEYSDYRIITATTDKSLAEKIKAKYCGEEAEIEEYEDAEEMLLDEYRFEYDADGNIVKARCYGVCDYISPDATVHNHRLIFVRAKSYDDAVKIAHERFAQWRWRIAERLER